MTAVDVGTSGAAAGRRPLTFFVPVWSIALLTLAVLWFGVITLAVSATVPYDAAVTGLDKGHCLVAWTSRAGTAHASDVACLGRRVGDRARLLMSDVESATFADQRAIQILEGIGLLFTLGPGLLGVGGRLLGIRRAAVLAPR